MEKSIQPLRDVRQILDKLKKCVTSLDEMALDLNNVDEAYGLLEELDRKVNEAIALASTLTRISTVSKENIDLLNTMLKHYGLYKVNLSCTLMDIRYSISRSGTCFSRIEHISHDLERAKEYTRDIEDLMIELEEEFKTLIHKVSLDLISRISIVPIREFYEELSQWKFNRTKDHLNSAVQLFGEKTTEKCMLCCASCRLAVESFIYRIGELHNVIIPEADRKTEKDFALIIKKLRKNSGLHERLEGPLIGFVQNLWSFISRAGSHEFKVNPTEQETYYAILQTHSLLRYLLYLHVRSKGFMRA